MPNEAACQPITNNHPNLQNMRLVLAKGMSYRLFESKGTYILSVPYNGAAMLELNIPLNDKERAGYKSQGRDYLDRLLEDIKANFSQYEARHLEINLKRF